jgi:signal transduction histidine kinase
MVTVGDNGIGMSPADLAVALEPFGQVDNRLERRYEGAGLGLSLAKAFIELHNGQMEFDSERAHGTRVTVTFPVEAGTLIFAKAG